jgi:HEAT repeat protein
VVWQKADRKERELTTSGAIFPLLALVALALGAAALGVELRRLLRDLAANHRLTRKARQSRVLRDLQQQTGSRTPFFVSPDLAHPEITQDAIALDFWLEHIRERDSEAGTAQIQVYEDESLIDRNLLVLMTSDSRTARAAAIGLLGWTGNPLAVPALLGVMEDTDPDSVALRPAILKALGRIRHPATISELIRALRSPDASVASTVCSLLAEFGEDAVEPLARLLADPGSGLNSRLRSAAILGEISHLAGLPALLNALEDEDATLRLQAVQSLSGFPNDRVVDRLLDHLLLDSSTAVRRSVAEGLARLASDRTLQFLVEALAETEPSIRRRAIEGLEPLGKPARGILTATLTDADRALARRAAGALERSGAVGSALRRLRERGYDVNASELLIDVGRAGHLDPLLQELDTTDETMLRTMVRILAHVGNPEAGEHLAPLLDRVQDQRLRARIVNALRRIGDGSHVQHLLPLLESSDEWLRKNVVDYLAEFGGPDIADAILSIIGDAKPWNRESALRVLEQIAANVSDATVVQERLLDPYDFIRAQAVRTLCAIGAFELLLEVDVLERVAEDRFRGALLQGLAHHSTVCAMPLITRLTAFCTDSELNLLRHAAGRAVDGLDESEIDLLMFSYAGPDQESSARWFATVGWCRASDKVAGTLRNELLADGDPRVRASMVFALSEREQDRADVIMALYKALDDPAPIVVRGALYTAGRLGIHELASAIVDACSHADEQVRVDATWVLSLLPGHERGRNHLEIGDLRRRQIVASTASRLHQSQASAVVGWVGHLTCSEDRQIIEDWIEQLHPLFRFILIHARNRDSLASRILLCRTPFAAEGLLLSELMTNDDEGTRLIALEAAIALGTRRCHGRINSAFFKDPSTPVRTRALVYLAQNNAFGRRREYIEQALRDPDPSLRSRAARLCGILPRAEAIAILGAHMESRQEEAPDAVIDTLASFAEDGIEDLVYRLGQAGSSPDYLAEVARVLNRCPGAAATKAMEELSAHDRAVVRVACIDPLVSKLGADAWSVIERGLDDPSAKVRAQAIQALGSGQNPELSTNSARVLNSLLKSHQDPHPEVRARTALALARLGVPNGMRILGTLETDQDPRVARIARLTRKELEEADRSGLAAPIDSPLESQQDPHPEVRARLGVLNAIRILRTLEADQDPRVAQIARLTQKELDEGDGSGLTAPMKVS